MERLTSSCLANTLIALGKSSSRVGVLSGIFVGCFPDVDPKPYLSRRPPLRLWMQMASRSSCGAAGPDTGQCWVT